MAAPEYVSYGYERPFFVIFYLTSIYGYEIGARGCTNGLGMQPVHPCAARVRVSPTMIAALSKTVTAATLSADRFPS
ncbi:hypothetical protein OIV57_34190, partial [Burkholderia pseudomallei]|uniref:hypothetical protein n=1 Tax=Burkholderia pseudomallei TaxID=28450 RepID=UPI0021F7DB6E